MNSRSFSFGTPGHPLAQALSLLVFAVVLVGAVIMGAFILVALLGLAVIAFLVFTYLAGAIFFLGADFAAAWPKVREPPPQTTAEREPLLHRARRLVRGLFVHERHPSGKDT